MGADGNAQISEDNLKLAAMKSTLFQDESPEELEEIWNAVDAAGRLEASPEKLQEPRTMIGDDPLQERSDPSLSGGTAVHEATTVSVQPFLRMAAPAFAPQRVLGLVARVQPSVKKSASLPPLPPRALCVFQNHPTDQAATLRENPNKKRNLGWICWDHGALCLKLKGVAHVTRHLISEIAQLGGDFKGLAGYSQDHAPSTHCGLCVGYEGEVVFGSMQEALRYLKQFFPLLAHPSNRGLMDHPTITQSWLDAL